MKFEVKDNQTNETEFYVKWSKPSQFKYQHFSTLNDTGKNNRFPILDILGYLKNTHKNPKFGKVRQVPIRELGWEFPGWDLSHFAKFGIFVGIL